MTTTNKIMYFHIGRGGSYNNAGHMTFCGQKDINEVLDLAEGNRQHSYLNNRDENGRFIKPAFYDQNGTFLITKEDADTGCGSIEWDTIYDADICLKLEDCSDEQLMLIYETTEYIDEDVRDWAKQTLIDHCVIFEEEEEEEEA